jgi:hypothetical protein
MAKQSDLTNLFNSKAIALARGALALERAARRAEQRALARAIMQGW